MTAKKIDVNPDLAFLDITPDLTADAQRRLNASLADIANLPLPDLRIQAQAGDFISRILGTSDPAAIGQFVGANGLTSSTIIAGKSYVLPSGTLSGDALNRASALGQSALNTDNVRLQARTDAVDAQAASAGAAWGQAGYRTVGAIADALIDGTSMAAQVKPILGGERLRTATMGAIAPRRITAISHCTRSVAMALRSGRSGYCPVLCIHSTFIVGDWQRGGKVVCPQRLRKLLVSRRQKWTPYFN